MDNLHRSKIVKSTIKWIMGTVKMVFRNEVMVNWIVGIYTCTVILLNPL